MTRAQSYRARLGRFACRAIAAIAVLTAAGCESPEVTTTTVNLERAWDVALACIVEEAGARRGAPMSECGADGPGAMHAFVLQSTPGTLGAVNLRSGRLLDLDPREPLHTSVEVGDLPNAIAAAPDGGLMLVANLGRRVDGVPEPGGYLSAVRPADVLGGLRSRPVVVTLPAPASAVVFVDAGFAVVAMPSISAVTSVRIAETGDDHAVGPPVALDTAPGPGGEPIEGLAAPWSLAVDEARGRVLVGDRNRGMLAVLVRDASGDLVVDRAAPLEGPAIALAVEPPGWGPAGDEPGRWIYAADGFAGGVMVLDAESLEPVDLSSGDPAEWRSQIVVRGLVKDVAIGRVEQQEPPERPDPKVLHGTFAFLVTSAGQVVVVDIEDRGAAACWSGSAAGEGDYACPRHVVRSGVPAPSTPYWSAPPSLLLPGGTPVTYDPQPSAEHPRFADWAAEDDAQPPRPTYGVPFDADARRAVNQTWAIEFEGAIPWTDGVGGNVERHDLDPGLAVLSDRGMPFCSRGVLAGDRLVIRQGPDPLAGTEADCRVFETPQIDASMERWRTEYAIADAFQDRLVLAPIPGGPPAPTEECFPYAVKFGVRVSGEWVVVGATTGLLHRVVAGPGGLCIEEPADCGVEPVPLRCLHSGRAVEGERFLNPYFSFTMVSGTSPTPRGLRYEMAAGGGFQALSEDVGALPAAGALDLSGRTGPALLVVDSASEGLVRVDLRRFALRDNWP